MATAKDPVCKRGHLRKEYGVVRHDKRGKSWIECRMCAKHLGWGKRNPDAPYEPDDISVARILAGDPPAWLHPLDRKAAAPRLLDRGVSLRQAAEWMRCTPRHVARLYRDVREERERGQEHC